MVTTHYLLTYTLDTRDPIGSKKLLHLSLCLGFMNSKVKLFAKKSLTKETTTKLVRNG